MGKDLCPKCLKVDRLAAEARRAARAKQISARDAAKKARLQSGQNAAA